MFSIFAVLRGLPNFVDTLLRLCFIPQLTQYPLSTHVSPYNSLKAFFSSLELLHTRKLEADLSLVHSHSKTHWVHHSHTWNGDGSEDICILWTYRRNKMGCSHEIRKTYSGSDITGPAKIGRRAMTIGTPSSLWTWIPSLAYRHANTSSDVEWIEKQQ